VIRHKFNSPISDDGIPDGEVKPSNWNDEHDADGVLGALLALDATANVLPYLDSSAQGQLASLTATGRAILACALVSDVLNFLGAATLASPNLTGTPTAPTAFVGTYSNQIATMAAVQNAINALIGGAPGALDTLNEFAAAINNDASFATTVTNALASRLRVDAAQGLPSPAMIQGRANLGLGSSAVLNAGAAASDVVQLDGSAKLPAVDGSQLTNIIAAWANITGKPAFAAVATSGAYADLTGKPTISPAAAGYVNKIRNGTIDVWQRGTSISVANGYTADGWQIAATGAAVTVSQAAGRALTRYSMKILGATGVTQVQLLHKIRSGDFQPLVGSTVTFQAWVFNGTGATITPQLLTQYPTAENNFGVCTTDLLNTNLQACPAGVWTQVAYAFPVSASAANLGYLLDIFFGALSGSQYVQITEVDIRATPGVATGLVSNPPIPELRPFLVEYATCRGYFRKSYSYGTAPGTATQVGLVGGITQGYNGNVSPVAIAFDTPMIATPSSISWWDSAGTANRYTQNIGNGWADGYNTSPVVQNQGTTGFQFYQGAQFSAFLHYAASAEL
jgi:hypothetical protein